MKQNIAPRHVVLILSIISSTKICTETIPYDATDEICTVLQQQYILSNIDEVIQKLGKILEAIVECIPLNRQRYVLIKALNTLIAAYIETSLEVDNLEELSNQSHQEIITQLRKNLTAKTRKGIDRSTELMLHSVANIIGVVTNACINGEEHPEIIGASVSNVLSEMVTIIAEKTRKNDASTGAVTVTMNAIMEYLAADPVLRAAVEEIILRRAEELQKIQQRSR